MRVIEIDNEPWFVGKDVALALGYRDVNRAVRQHIDKEDLKALSRKGYGDSYPSLWVNKNDFANKVLINESGVYSLIFSSELESAKKFKHWVTHEVLPSIRKHGAYMTDDILERTLSDPDFMINLLTNLKEEKEKRKLAEERTSKLIHNSRTYTATEISKELGFKSAKAFNKDLENKKIQYKVNGVWVLSADYSDKNYVSIKQQELDNGTVIYNRHWTGLGRDWLLNEIYKCDK